MHRLTLPFFILMALAALPSCKRIQDKLERLAEKSGALPPMSGVRTPTLGRVRMAKEGRMPGAGEGLSRCGHTRDQEEKDGNHRVL